MATTMHPRKRFTGCPSVTLYSAAVDALRAELSSAEPLWSGINGKSGNS